MLAMELIFPSEIWEQILRYLSPQGLLAASSVCRQWRHLARRICRVRCRALPSRLLEELTHEQLAARPRPQDESLSLKHKERFEPDWLDVTRMFLQTQVTSRPEDCSVVAQLKRVILLAAAETFVVVVSRCDDDQSCSVNLADATGHVTCQHTVPGKINKVCVLEGGAGPSVLAVSVDKELLGLLVPPQLSCLVALNVTPTLSVDSRMCCDGQTLVASQLVEEYHLSVYHASLHPGRLDLSLLNRIRATAPPVCWDLWNGFVTVLVPTGHVCSYTLSGTLVAESPLYKDLRYPNPTLLARGLVLASTITSRALLSYWHMDRDRDYWLVGESVLTSWVQRGAHAVGNSSSPSVCHQGGTPDEQSPRTHTVFEAGSSCVVTLAKVRIGASMLLEVTVVHYQRGLVFCGTSQGHLLVYRIMERGHEGGTGLQWEVMEACVPSLCLSLSQRPLARIAVCFIDSVIMVAVGDRDGNCHTVSLPNSLASP